jgi:hypothetical protein
VECSFVTESRIDAGGERLTLAFRPARIREKAQDAHFVPASRIRQARKSRLFRLIRHLYETATGDIVHRNSFFFVSFDANAA